MPLPFDHIGTSTGRKCSAPLETCPDKPTFFGPTGHNVIFKETENYLSQLNASDVKYENTGISDAQPTNRILFKELPPHIQEISLAVLGCVFGPYYSTLIANGIQKENRLWSNLTVPAILNSLESIFGSNVDPGKLDLERIAEQISNNTTKPFRDIETSSQEWIDQLCGPNLRWESIALLWSVLRRIPGSFNPIEQKQLHILENGTADESILSFLRHSTKLARHFTLANVIMLDLTFQKTIMESMIVGDASLVCWVSHSETVAMMTYLGVHIQGNNSTTYKPTLDSEYRRRLFTRIYNIDKSVATFTGRPPLINPRFVNTPPPLDLSDDDLAAGGIALDHAVAKLDPLGWNIEGGVYASTFCRVCNLTSVILNEIIEITFGSESTATVEMLRNLKQREVDCIAQVPKTMIYEPEDLSNLPLPQDMRLAHERDLSDPPLGTNIVSIKIFFWLTHLQNMFLIERLMVQYGDRDEGDVLVVSFEMISLTLLFWTRKDRFREMRRDMEWLLMAFAVPGGGILCQELLRPTFQGKHPKDNRLTRSSIVQQLSLLVGFLDWVHPSAPNGDLCASCKTVIQRVLDYHLNDLMNDAGSLEHFSSGLARPLNFKFELLNTFDWLHPR